MSHHQIVIFGAGSAGLTEASQLKNKLPDLDIAIIDPATKHFYQPLWTLVGAGIFPKEDSIRNQAEFIPYGTRWIQEYVTSFDPDNNKITLKNGKLVNYNVLVVAAGIQVDWDKIPGLKESVGKSDTGVCSNYDYDTVDSTWNNIKSLNNGTAIFTHPAAAIKCGGAPIKIAFLAADY